jgi:multidrug efflux pump subunit AcrB
MWIVKLALDRPYTFVVVAILVLIMGALAIIPGTPLATPVDIFPNINIPVVSIVWNYTGFSPQDMEGHIVTITERALTTTVNDIEHIESTSLNGVAVVKVYFHPNVKIDMAVAQITAVSQTQLRQLPAGTTPPLILQYSASSVPIVQMSLASPSESEQTLNDLSLNFVRVRLTTIQGAAIPYPYGGKQRLVSVDINIPALQARGLTPNDVVNAISAQNLILPSGTAKIGTLEYDIAMNGSPLTADDLNNVPVKVQNGAIIYVRDVAHVRDGFSPQTNIVRQEGVRSTLLSIIKNGNVSTLKIVDDVKNLIPAIKAIIPSDVQVRTLFDQSLFVKASISGVAREAIIAACLTALMILLFLGDWRSTLIIAISIPLSVLSSIIILSALGETLNIMTLGGLALAVGILVDDATVTIENIDNYHERGHKKRDAILKGASQIAVPAFVSSICICIVFVPMFALSGVARFLFVPLAESVVFAVLASYFFSRTLVPTLAMYLMKDEEGGDEGQGEGHPDDPAGDDRGRDPPDDSPADGPTADRHLHEEQHPDERYVPKKVQPALQQAAVALHRAGPGADPIRYQAQQQQQAPGGDDEPSDLYEQARRDHEQAVRDHEQAQRDREGARRAHGKEEQPGPHREDDPRGENAGDPPRDDHGQPLKKRKKKEPTGIFGRFQAGFERRFEKLREGYHTRLDGALRHHWLFAILFLALCLGSLLLLPFLGQDFFPTVDAGQFKLHIRAKTGTRIEETARLCDEIEKKIHDVIPPKDLDSVLDNIGLPYSGINLSYSNSGVIGSADADIQVALKPGHRPTADYQKELRIKLPQEFPGTLFMFQPADIVNQILNFGLPAPIDVQIIGTDVGKNLATAIKIQDELKQVPGAVDVHVQQPYDEPRFNILMDRSQAERTGITAQQIAQSVLVALSGSFQTSPAFWLNPKNGVTYNIAIQAPQYNVSSLQDLENLPVHGTGSSQILANLASIQRNAEPAAVYHYNVRPVIDVYANVQGRDLGAVADQVQKIVDGHRKDLPTGTEMSIRGQVKTMHDSFVGLGGGLVGAIVLVYLLMVVNFQSWSEPFIIIMALPGALAGICWMLFLTGTTLSVPALMGAIMCIGVATANSILVISFAKERFAESGDAHQAVLEAGTTRLRPVIMTALAMIIGMVPMALGLGEGGEQNAPLGRAVIGGLMVATIATLFFVPTVYSIVRGKAKRDDDRDGRRRQPERHRPQDDESSPQPGAARPAHST